MPEEPLSSQPSSPTDPAPEEEVKASLESEQREQYPAAPQPVSPERPQFDRKPSVPQEEQPAPLPTEMPESTQEQTRMPTPPASYPQEKKELFLRQEVKTMRKDLSRLQEEEAMKERERISKLKTDDEIKKELERIARLKKEEEEKMYAVKDARVRNITSLKEGESLKKKEIESARILEETSKREAREKELTKRPSYRLPFPLPKRPSVLDKLFSRTVVIVVIVAIWGVIGTFWYWYFAVRPKQPPVEAPKQETPKEEAPVVPEEAPPEIKEPIIPPALIPIDSERRVEYSSEEELPQLLGQAVQQYGGEEIITRLMIYSSADKTFLNLPDFARILKVEMPQDIISKLSPDFTLFVYSSTIANRLGFAAQITDINGFHELVRSWEPAMERDTENLFNLLGKKAPSAGGAFRQINYKGATFRYISFPSINFGLVWSILPLTDRESGEARNYFVFTSSGESMMRVIDRVADRIVK